MTSFTSAFRKNISQSLQASLEQQAQRGCLRELQVRGAQSGLSDFSSNDYLGLHHDPRVTQAAMEAVTIWGTGSTGSRLVSGNTQLIEQFEGSLAEFCDWESALVFSSGYLANMGIITALHKTAGRIFSDQGAHASLIDGCRLSRSQITVFPRGDVTALYQLVEAYRLEHPYQATAGEVIPLIITDAVYSIDGKLAPIQEYYAIAQKFQAILLVDEAHSIGILGPQGKGLVYDLGLSMAEGLIITGTLSKSFGTQGGFILAHRLVRDYCINFARQFIFDTALAPVAVGAATQALAIMQSSPEIFSHIRALHKLLQNELSARDIPYLHDDIGEYSPAILSLNIPDPTQAKAAQLLCQEYGYQLGCFRPPSVPIGGSLLRITLHAQYTAQDIVNLAMVIEQVYRELGLQNLGKHQQIQLCSMIDTPSNNLQPQNPHYICIAGTDTGIGKTFSAAALALALRAQGYKIMVIKPVQTGTAIDEISDAQMITRLVEYTDISVCQLYGYPEALAPHQAANVAGMALPTLRELVDEITITAGTVDYVIIEGSGGVLVPLSADNGTILDIAHSLSAGIVLVVRPNLGTLNHTHMSVEAMKHRGLPLTGIIVGALPEQSDLATELNIQEFTAGHYGTFLGAIPAGSTDMPVKKFQNKAARVVDVNPIIKHFSAIHRN